jgi:hypothetical protein
MGKSRVSIRTLSTGERVRHYPPDDYHPEGRMVLIREEGSVLDPLLNQCRADNEQAVGDLHTIAKARADLKRASEAANPPVPPEKRFL